MTYQELELKTNTTPTLVTLDANQLTYETYDSAVRSELSEGAVNVASYLIQHHNQPLLGTWITQDINDYLQHKTSVARAFKELRKSGAGSAGLAEHLVSVGRSKATWYGLLTENTDDAKRHFCYRGLSVLDTISREREKERRQQPFVAFLQYLDDDHAEHTYTVEPQYKLGAAAVAITVGVATAATVWALKKRND